MGRHSHDEQPAAVLASDQLPQLEDAPPATPISGVASDPPAVQRSATDRTETLREATAELSAAGSAAAAVTAAEVPAAGVPAAAATGATAATDGWRDAPDRVGADEQPTQYIARIRDDSAPAHNPRLAALVTGTAAGAPATAQGEPVVEDEPHSVTSPRPIGMWLATVLLWLIALPVGVACAVLTAAKRINFCTGKSAGFGCTGAGTASGAILFVVVVAAVGIVSVYAYDARRHRRRWLRPLGIGLAVIAVVGFLAFLALDSIK